MIRRYKSTDGITGYSEGDILVCEDTGERLRVVRDGRGLCLVPCDDVEREPEGQS